MLLAQNISCPYCHRFQGTLKYLPVFWVSRIYRLAFSGFQVYWWKREEIKSSMIYKILYSSSFDSLHDLLISHDIFLEQFEFFSEYEYWTKCTQRPSKSCTMTSFTVRDGNVSVPLLFTAGYSVTVWFQLLIFSHQEPDIPYFNYDLKGDSSCSWILNDFFYLLLQIWMPSTLRPSSDLLVFRFCGSSIFGMNLHPAP